MASNIPEGLPYTTSYEAWAEEISERTDGRITFVNHFGDSLVTYDNIAKSVRDGQVELGQVAPQANPDLFPMSPIVGVPGATPDVAAAVAAYRELYQDYEPFRAEWESAGVVPLLFQPTPGNVFVSKDRLERPEDIRGMRVRASGPMIDVLNALGASSVQISTPEIYEGLQRGVIDAVTSQTLSSTSTGSWAEVAPYVHDLGLGSGGLVAVFVNKGAYDSIPEDLRQIIREVSDEFDQNWAELLIEDGEKACQGVLDQDAVLVEWTKAQKQALNPAFGKAQDEFIADIGANGQEFWDRWSKAVEGYDGRLGKFSGSDLSDCLDQ